MTPAAFTLLVSTTAASLGVPLTATVTNTPEARFTLDLERSTTDTFAILNAQDVSERKAGAGAELRLQLLPLAVGAVPVRLFWKVEGQAEPVAGPALTLGVAEPPLEEPTLADIKPPLDARGPLWPWLLGAALLAAAAWWWSRRRKAESLAALEAEPPRPPHEAAFEAFERLEPLWAEGRRREFYFALTDALRLYFERRFDVPATRQTTSELLRGLTRAGLDRAVASRARAVFERADLVKFADVRPQENWGPADLLAARACVADTTPAAPAPDSPSETAGARGGPK